MEYKLVKKFSHSVRMRNGKRRSISHYYLNGVKIFEQKSPFCDLGEYGVGKWCYENIYIMNNKLYQTRYDMVYDHTVGKFIKKGRDVYYPLSKSRLKPFNIPKDHRIDLIKYDPVSFKRDLIINEILELCI